MADLNFTAAYKMLEIGMNPTAGMLYEMVFDATDVGLEKPLRVTVRSAKAKRDTVGYINWHEDTLEAVLIVDTVEEFDRLQRLCEGKEVAFDLSYGEMVEAQTPLKRFYLTI